MPIVLSWLARSLPGSVMSRPDRSGWLYAAATIAIWSGFVLTARIAGKSPLTHWDLTALRFGTAAPVLFLLWWFWQRVPLVTGRMLTLALVGGIAYALMAYAGFRYAPTAHGALLLSGILPFTMAVAAWLVLKEVPTRQRQRGLLLIGLGVVCLASEHLQWNPRVLFGDLLFVSASFAWAVYSALIKRWAIPPWHTTIGVALVAGLLYLPVYGLFLPHGLGAAPLGTIVFQSVYQGLLVVIVAMVLYLQAMARLGPARLATVMALVPPLAGIGGSLLLAEPLTTVLVAGLLLVSAGAWLGSR